MGNLASYGRSLLSLTSYEHGMSRLASPGLGFPFLSDELSVCPHAPLSHPHFGLENGSCPVRAGGSGTRRSKPSVGWSSGFLCLLVCFLRSPQAPPPPTSHCSVQPGLFMERGPDRAIPTHCAVKNPWREEEAGRARRNEMCTVFSQLCQILLRHQPSCEDSLL